MEIKLTVTQVKALQRRLGEGEKVEIRLVPCKMNPNNLWDKGYTAEIDKDTNLEKLINSFSYYNCNSETGLYPHYYKKE